MSARTVSTFRRWRGAALAMPHDATDRPCDFPLFRIGNTGRIAAYPLRAKFRHRFRAPCFDPTRRASASWNLRRCASRSFFWFSGDMRSLGLRFVIVNLAMLRVGSASAGAPSPMRPTSCRRRGTCRDRSRDTRYASPQRE